ncbi:MAG: hypothetical protein R2747_15470 [Pyrinomonadaceae bacterium]
MVFDKFAGKDREIQSDPFQIFLSACGQKVQSGVEIMTPVRHNFANFRASPVKTGGKPEKFFSRRKNLSAILSRQIFNESQGFSSAIRFKVKKPAPDCQVICLPVRSGQVFFRMFFRFRPGAIFRITIGFSICRRRWIASVF